MLLSRPFRTFPLLGQGLGRGDFAHSQIITFLNKIKKESSENQRFSELLWLRGKDLNQRPPGYEPDELPAALPRDIYLACK